MNKKTEPANMLCGFTKQVNIEAAYIHIIDINVTVSHVETFNTHLECHKILNKNKILTYTFYDTIPIKHSFYRSY